MDTYSHFCCCAASAHLFQQEVLMPRLPLGSKLQLLVCTNTPCHNSIRQTQDYVAAASVHMAGPSAQPHCNMCGTRPATAAGAASRVLSGRSSPVRDALRECWQDATRELCVEEQRMDAHHQALQLLLARQQQRRRQQLAQQGGSGCCCSCSCSSQQPALTAPAAAAAEALGAARCACCCSCKELLGSLAEQLQVLEWSADRLYGHLESLEAAAASHHQQQCAMKEAPSKPPWKP